jgi:hypothetical protein
MILFYDERLAIETLAEAVANLKQQVYAGGRIMPSFDRLINSLPVETAFHVTVKQTEASSN